MTAVHTTAKDSLAGYKEWRKNIVPLTVGTIITWPTGYASATISDSIKARQCFMVVALTDGLCKVKGGAWLCEADKTYKMIHCSKHGKLHNKYAYWGVESIARQLVDGAIEIVAIGEPQ